MRNLFFLSVFMVVLSSIFFSLGAKAETKVYKEVGQCLAEKIGPEAAGEIESGSRHLSEDEKMLSRECLERMMF